LSRIRLQWEGKGSTPPPESPAPVPLPEIKDTNLLLQGDNYIWLNWLREKGVKGDLIYMDPPFCTGNRFSSKVRIGKENVDVENLGFQDFWGSGSETFLEMLRVRLVLCREILAQSGSIFVHLDWRTSHATKLIMDEIFGPENFRNEIIWWYHDPSGYTKKNYMRKHDTILFYSKSDDYKFNMEEVRVPYSKGTMNQAEKGVISFGRKTKVNPRGKPPEDVWEVPIINSQAKERLGYPTQKPLALLERIIKGSSDPGELVIDPFCGSGTTLEAADNLGRKWIGIDQNNFGLFLTGKRVKNNFTFSRDKKFLGRKGKELQKEFYKKNPSPGVEIVTKPRERDLDVLLKGLEGKTVHWWDIDFPWLRLEDLEETRKNLFLFPLYDQTGFPLGKLQFNFEIKENNLKILVKDYEQPFRENTPLERINPQELLEKVNVLVDGQKLTVVYPPLPREATLPLKGNEQELSLQMIDIFGRERFFLQRLG